MTPEFTLYLYGDYSPRNYRDAFIQTGCAFQRVEIRTENEAKDIAARKLRGRIEGQPHDIRKNFPILTKGNTLVVHGDALFTSLVRLLDLYKGGRNV